MTSIARRHHYLPQAYLAAFTDTGTKEGAFYVLDVDTLKSFETSPLNVAVERDFNRVDIEGHSPDAIEQALAPFEQEAIAAIQRTVEARAFPAPEALNWILNLLALMAVRNPQMRKSFNRAREETIRHIGNLLVSDERLWESHIRSAREAGEPLPENVSFEDMKRFVESGEYDLEFAPEGNLRVEFDAMDTVLPLLGQRMWSLFLTEDGGPEFVCSDHPVTLVWKEQRRGPVGFGLKQTEVFFPLSRQAGLYGTFEDRLEPVLQVDAELVASMNTRVVFNAGRHVFSPLDSFVMILENHVRDIRLGGSSSIYRTSIYRTPT